MPRNKPKQTGVFPNVVTNHVGDSIQNTLPGSKLQQTGVSPNAVTNHVGNSIQSISLGYEAKKQTEVPPNVVTSHVGDSNCDSTGGTHRNPATPLNLSKPSAPSPTLQSPKAKQSSAPMPRRRSLSAPEATGQSPKAKQLSAAPPQRQRSKANVASVPPKLRSAFEAKLRRLGVPVSQFGVGEARTLDDLFWEVQRRESVLGMHKGVFKRLVKVLRLEIWANTNAGKRILVHSAESMEDGRVRWELRQRVAKKMATDELTEDAVKRSLATELGLDSKWQLDNLEFESEEEVICEKVSMGFPGIVTVYMFRTVVMWVVDPTRKDCAIVGLPNGDNFQTIELSMLGQNRKHKWTWLPELEDDTQDDRCDGIIAFEPITLEFLGESDDYPGDTSILVVAPSPTLQEVLPKPGLLTRRGLDQPGLPVRSKVVDRGKYATGGSISPASGVSPISPWKDEVGSSNLLPSFRASKCASKFKSSPGDCGPFRECGPVSDSVLPGITLAGKSSGKCDSISSPDVKGSTPSSKFDSNSGETLPGLMQLMSWKKYDSDPGYIPQNGTKPENPYLSQISSKQTNASFELPISSGEFSTGHSGMEFSAVLSGDSCPPPETSSHYPRHGSKIMFAEPAVEPQPVSLSAQPPPSPHPPAGGVQGSGVHRQYKAKQCSQHTSGMLDKDTQVANEFVQPSPTHLCSIHPEMLKTLRLYDGFWIRAEDDTALCEIKDGLLKWHLDYNQGTNTLTIGKDEKLTMVLDDEVCTAQMINGTLVWNDGDRWMRGRRTKTPELVDDGLRDAWYPGQKSNSS